MPHTVYFSPTFSCNLRCQYCLSKFNSGKTQVPIFDLIKILEKYLHGEYKIVFRGGEIFFYTHIKELLSFLIYSNIDTKIVFSFVTNGVLVYKYIDHIPNILKKGNELHFVFSTDLDKNGDIKNRFGTEKNYIFFLVSLRLLQKLQKKYSNLRLLSSTVLLWESKLSDFIRGYNFRKENFDVNLYGIEQSNSNSGMNNNIYEIIIFLYNEGVIIENLIGPFYINETEYDNELKRYNSEIYIKDFYNQGDNISENFMNDIQILKRFDSIFNTKYKINTALLIIDFYLKNNVSINYYEKLSLILKDKINVVSEG